MLLSSSPHILAVPPAGPFSFKNLPGLVSPLLSSSRVLLLPSFFRPFGASLPVVPGTVTHWGAGGLSCVILATQPLQPPTGTPKCQGSLQVLPPCHCFMAQAAWGGVNGRGCSPLASVAVNQLTQVCAYSPPASSASLILPLGATSGLSGFFPLTPFSLWSFLGLQRASFRNKSSSGSRMDGSQGHFLGPGSPGSVAVVEWRHLCSVRDWASPLALSGLLGRKQETPSHSDS